MTRFLGLLLLAAMAVSAQTTRTPSGTQTPYVQQGSGARVSGHCAQWDADGRLIDAGSGCSAGGAFSTLSDVVVSSPQDGQCSIYDGVAQKWKNAACPVSGTNGTVTSVTFPTIPSWLTAVVTNISTTPSIAITATSGQTANQFVASPSGSTGSVGLRSIVAADLPTNITSNTSGNATTATALAGTPSQCSTGQAPTGILANGNATGCAAIGSVNPGGGLSSIAAVQASQTINITCGTPCMVNGFSFANFSGSVSGFPAATTYSAYVYADNGAVKYGFPSGTTPTSCTSVTCVSPVSAMPSGPNIYPIATVTLSSGSLAAVTDVRNAGVSQPDQLIAGTGISFVRSGAQLTLNATSGGPGNSGVSHACYRVNYNQTSLAGGTTRVSLSTGLTFPANTVVVGTWLKTNTTFAGVTGVGLSVGNSVSDTAYANVYDLTQGVSSTNLQAETGFASNTAASQNLLLIFTGSANLSGLSAGQVDACILYQTLTAETAPTVL